MEKTFAVFMIFTQPQNNLFPSIMALMTDNLNLRTSMLPQKFSFLRITIFQSKRKFPLDCFAIYGSYPYTIDESKDLLHTFKSVTEL